MLAKRLCLYDLKDFVVTYLQCWQKDCVYILEGFCSNVFTMLVYDNISRKAKRLYLYDLKGFVVTYLQCWYTITSLEKQKDCIYMT